MSTEEQELVMAQTTNFDEALRRIGPDSTATFDNSASNPTEHGSSESLRSVADDEDEEFEDTDDEEEDVEDDDREVDDGEAREEPLRVK
jgi:hypothetical protein